MKLGSANLLPGFAPEVERAIQDSAPGMAHFAGTGPDGKTCGQCKNRGYRRESKNFKINIETLERTYNTYRHYGCMKFYRMTQNHGPDIKKGLKACKYFDPKSE